MMRKASKNVEDHLGSVTYKVADMLDDLVRVVLGTELWVTGIKQVLNSIILHGCFLQECSVQNSVVGDHSRLEYNIELQDTMMMGVEEYQSESEIAALLADGNVLVGM
ncbi:hypothetical protein C5167_049929 [Papaver somniferum]|uniref:glucose-1-phosphate adenylyltransferase n=1 Tax=Papaver somniferum TaxID=3469 RepID=A0A4Y7KR56_PAPSO|nr:hypothetical protein C5167_049929 [Papaver somniferum]